jgi:hypothetical protein
MEHTSVTMRPPPVTPAPARSLPGPVATGVQGKHSPVVGTHSEHAGSVGPAGSAKPGALPPAGITYRSPQPERATTSVGQASRWHPGVASSQGGMAPTSQSFAGQEKHPASPDAVHLHAPARAFHPPAQAPPPAQALHRTAQAPRPVQASHPPAQVPQPARAFHPQAQVPHPIQAFHPSAQVPHPLQATHPPAPAPQTGKGGGASPQAPKGGSPAPAHDGKGDKHD